MDWRGWHSAAALLGVLSVWALAPSPAVALSKKIDRPFPTGICPLPAESSREALTFEATDPSTLLTVWRQNGNNRDGVHVYQGFPYVAIVRRDFYDANLTENTSGCYATLEPDVLDPAPNLTITAPPTPQQVPFQADFSLPDAYSGWFLCHTVPPESGDLYPDELRLGEPPDAEMSNRYVSASVAVTSLQPGATYVVYVLWHMVDFEFDDSPTSADNAADNLVIRTDPLPAAGAGGCGCDADGDVLGEACDTCPGLNDPDQIDGDGDGRGDLCDVCPSAPDPGQLDADGDLRGDVCDNCPAVANAAQTDSDGDGTGDACECLGVVCVPSDPCHLAGECNDATGLCSSGPARPDGSSCADSNACNGLETCQSGTCTPGTSVTCNTPPACRTPAGAACDQQTGACSYPSATNGTSCADSNACNGLETCQSGTCTPGTSVTCNTPSACRTPAGATCDQQTGACSYPSAPNGTSCPDSNACNGLETCQSGTCTPGSSVTCNTPPACRTPAGATCDQQTGACSYPSAPNGTSCSDSNACTVADVCTAGACGGRQAAAPELKRARIDFGAESTYSRAVSLNLTVLRGDAVEVLASEDPFFPGAVWRPNAFEIPFSLSGGAGRKTVYVMARACPERSSRVVKDSIKLMAPKLSFYAIAEGGTTSSREVELLTVARGDPSESIASENSDFAGAVWGPYTSSLAFTLSAGAGKKNVYFKVRNGVGESKSRKDSITLTE